MHWQGNLGRCRPGLTLLCFVSGIVVRIGGRKLISCRSKGLQKQQLCLMSVALRKMYSDLKEKTLIVHPEIEDEQENNN